MNLTLDIEYTIPQWLRKRFLKSFRKHKPNKYENSNALTQWRHHENNLSQEALDEVFSEEVSLVQTSFQIDISLFLFYSDAMSTSRRTQIPEALLSCHVA